MALSCGSLLLPVQSEAAPQTCEDPRGSTNYEHSDQSVTQGSVPFV